MSGINLGDKKNNAKYSIWITTVYREAIISHRFGRGVGMHSHLVSLGTYVCGLESKVERRGCSELPLAGGGGEFGSRWWEVRAATTVALDVYAGRYAR